MPRSEPVLPDVRVTAPEGPPIIDSVQAVTGGGAPYCRRCGQADTIIPTVLAGLIGPIPDHRCDTPAAEPALMSRPTVTSLPGPFS